MARKVKFSLELKDGYEARNNIEEIKKYFDYNKILDYFIDGRLSIWLEDRRYYEEKEKLDDLDVNELNFRDKICAIFGVQISDHEEYMNDGNYFLNLALKYKECDSSKYIELLMKAAEMSNSTAMRKLGEYYTEENAWDIDEAEKWFRQAAMGEDVESLVGLGAIYYHHYDDYETAKRYYEQAAEQGNAEGMYCLGKYYEEIKSDIKTAVELYKKAAQNGDDDAMVELGNYYIDEERYDDACIWFSRAAEKGNSNAQNKMGEIMFQGLGHDVDLDLAFLWFEKAAKDDCAEAIYNLAQCYTYGYGVRKDLNKAKELYEKSAQCGINDAKWFLDKIVKF